MDANDLLDILGASTLRDILSTLEDLGDDDPERGALIDYIRHLIDTLE